MLVVDASCVAEVVLAGPDAEPVRERLLGDSDQAAPHLVDAEVLGVVDAIVPEPAGGAHRDPAAAIAAAGAAIADALAELRGLDRATIVRLRREKFVAIGRALG